MADQSITPVVCVVVYADFVHRDAVIKLWRCALGNTAGHNEASLVIDKKLAVADGLFFVAMADGVLVGTAMAGYDGHRGWLYSICVDQGQRGLGIGAVLVSHAEAALTDLGCVKINLQIADGNEGVTGFYESLGFVVEKRVSMGKISRAFRPN